MKICSSKTELCEMILRPKIFQIIELLYSKNLKFYITNELNYRNDTKIFIGIILV